MMHRLDPGHAWTVRKWDDPKTEAQGVEITLEPADAVDAYWSNFWLPVVGPTCTILAARLAAHTLYEPAEPLEAQYLSSSMGLGKAVGSHCALARALGRLEQFQIVRFPDDDVIEARTHARPLTPHQHDRLPTGLKEAHMSWLRLTAGSTPPTGSTRAPTPRARSCGEGLRSDE